MYSDFDVYTPYANDMDVNDSNVRTIVLLKQLTNYVEPDFKAIHRLIDSDASLRYNDCSFAIRNPHLIPLGGIACRSTAMKYAASKLLQIHQQYKARVPHLRVDVDLYISNVLYPCFKEQIDDIIAKYGNPEVMLKERLTEEWATHKPAEKRYWMSQTPGFKNGSSHLRTQKVSAFDTFSDYRKGDIKSHEKSRVIDILYMHLLLCFPNLCLETGKFI